MNERYLAGAPCAQSRVAKDGSRILLKLMRAPSTLASGGRGHRSLVCAQMGADKRYAGGGGTA